MTTAISPTDVIAEIDYENGWSFNVIHKANGPCLIIDYPNGYSQIPLPLVALRYMTPQRVALWVLEQVRDIEKRQAEAAFTYAGQRVGEL